MAEFTDDIFEALMGDEGRVYTDRPTDPGGPTNRGVTLATLRAEGLDLDGDGDVDADDVRLITDPVAKRIALTRYWQRYRCGEIRDQRLAAKVFGHVYNSPLLAIVALQRACRACDRPVPVDGGIGPVTLAAVNLCDPSTLLAAFRSEMAGAYRVLAAETKDRSNLDGWENRAYR